MAFLLVKTSDWVIQNEFGSFSEYIWNFTNGKPIRNEWEDLNNVPATTELSESISKDLKKRGWCRSNERLVLYVTRNWNNGV